MTNSLCASTKQITAVVTTRILIYIDNALYHNWARAHTINGTNRITSWMEFFNYMRMVANT